MTNREIKSKVMSLGNRLAVRMDRGSAFVQAWAIVKASGLELAVKGVTFGNRQEALKRLAAYSPEQIRTVLVPEPSNPQDPAAVAVLVGVQNGKGLFKLGYVPRELTAVLEAIRGNPALKFPALRIVSRTWGWSGKTTLGARVALAV
jgi:ribosomal protein L16/L10AE